MNKKFIVRLSDEERAVCQEVIKKLKGSSQKVRRAYILLRRMRMDRHGPTTGLPRLSIAACRPSRTSANAW